MCGVHSLFTIPYRLLFGIFRFTIKTKYAHTKVWKSPPNSFHHKKIYGNIKCVLDMNKYPIMNMFGGWESLLMRVKTYLFPNWLKNWFMTFYNTCHSLTIHQIDLKTDLLPNEIKNWLITIYGICHSLTIYQSQLKPIPNLISYASFWVWGHEGLMCYQ